MKLSAGLFFAAGLWLVLLPCCCCVQADNPKNISDSASPNRTSYTSPAPVTKLGNITAPTIQNGTLSTIPSAAPPNTNASTPTTNTTITTTIINSTTTAKTAPAKNNTTKSPPTSSKSPSVTVATPKAPSSANTTVVTATAKAGANLSRSSGFDVGSFIGGIVLTLGLLVIGYIGCRTYHAKRGVQYRTIDEHDAII